MIRGLRGEEGAHASLLRAVLPLLRSFYRRRMARAEADIEDLIQEVLIAVHTRRATYDPSGAYFGHILVNLCRPSDSVTVTGLNARAKTPGTGTGQPAIDHKTP